jgi:AcrR family transcriptional regulator
MKNTKEKILDTALELFNTLGLSKVTLRTIAKEMGISQGNLNYHYKKRDDIIEALYFQLVKNIDESFKSQNKSKSVFHSLFKISDTTMINFYNYRFIFLDFVQIMRENNKIKRHYLELTEQRESQFMQLFDLLIKEGVLRKPIIKDEYINLYKRIQIMGDFWISSAVTTSKSFSKKYIPIYSEIINQNIFPYLTEKGRDEYHSVFSR